MALFNPELRLLFIGWGVVCCDVGIWDEGGPDEGAASSLSSGAT